MNKVPLLGLVAIALLLGGCGTTKFPTSVTGGECKVFERPEYAVRGVAVYDQAWIDSQIEGGVGACKWARPAARPPEIDARPAARYVAPPVVKRKGIVRRALDGLKSQRRTPVRAISGPPATSVAPFPQSAPAITPTPVPPPVAAPAAAPLPRSRFDELVRPRG